MNIKLVAICVLTTFCVGYVTGEYCYNDVVGACSPVGGEVTNCNSKYGAFKGEEILSSFQYYSKSHILRSFQYLLMSSHFGNYEKNRGGFEKLYRKLSDDTWQQAIDIVKFISKRGGHMDFRLANEEKNDKIIDYEMYELGSMAKALDIQKRLASEAFHIHSEVTRVKEHDPEVASYIENNFVHKHSSLVRDLAGHTNDLKHLIANQPDPSLSLYLFDEYLQKTI
ncbi:ferritin heavy polypeptide-like 17 [Adelges cooleyi]|uniref:ferritin heavy polypeptide-like 17 n=1 Tax=Adelges cooleyi TaxID=133065 RepID=UPI0021805835|nr:ferritin heavy polypeptide-like 17 [Adelges cooleyi]XP_050438758.1 ferritin heavy polypeptide-like 17 [Adelges cooleyi]